MKEDSIIDKETTVATDGYVYVTEVVVEDIFNDEELNNEITTERENIHTRNTF